LQKGYVCIPKSKQIKRIIENGAVFDFKLSTKDMADLDALDEDFHTCWDPTTTKWAKPPRPPQN